MSSTRQPVVQISALDAETLAIKTASFISGPDWSRYVATCRRIGATFRAAIKANTAPIAGLAGIVSGLTEAGFVPQLHPELAAAVQAKADALKQNAAQLTAAMQSVVDALAAKNLTLWGFQIEGVGWLRTDNADLSQKRVKLLGDTMGLGKTVQAAVAIPDEAHGVLVICPAVVKGNWRREFYKWRRELTVKVLEGRNSFRWPRAGEVVISNFDILPEEFAAPPTGVVIIIDEAHALKSTKTQRTKRAKALVKAVLQADGWTWLLTGTPQLNHRAELWNLLGVIRVAEDLFGSWPRFQYMSDAEVASALKRVMLKRKREEVLPDLPTKMHAEPVVIAIDQQTRDILDRAYAAMRAAGIDFDRAVDFAASTKIGGPAFEEIAAARAALATAKIPAAIDFVSQFEDEGEPIVVFSAHRAPIDLLAARPGWAAITGDITGDKRDAVVQQFQNGDLKGLAVTIKAGGVGITLTRAHQALFIDREWTPALNAQAEDRICRIGQTRGCIIHDLVADHDLDRNVTAKNIAKQLAIDATVEAAAVVESKSASEITAQAELLTATLDQARIGVSAAGVVRGTAATPASALTRRGPASIREEWARELLTGGTFDPVDATYATKLRGLVTTQGLTDDEWHTATSYLTKYRGITPEPTPAAVEMPF